MTEYTNRYGDKFTFELNERGNIQWSGNFEYCRLGYSSEPDDIIMVDPSGGPYVDLDTNMRLYDFPNKEVVGFIRNDDGFEIVVRK